MAKKRKLETKTEAAAPAKEPETKSEEVKPEEPAEEQVQMNEGEEEEEEEEEEEMEAEDAEAEEEEEEEEEEDEEPQNALSQDPSSTNPNGDSVDADDDEDVEEPVSKLVEPFTKEQLVDLLREAAENHPDVLDRIRKVAETDPVHRKIFVHGLGWDTNAELLTNVFKVYGEIEDCNAVCDKITGKSKGYGFILFKHRSGARKALKEPQKKIGNRMTACQLASAGPVPPPAPAAPPASEYTQRKIYVSNVSADIDPQKLVNFFAKFGEIEEGPLGLDKHTGKPKGFALFVYKSVESAKKALDEPHKNFEGHILHCQKAIDGPKPNKGHHHQGHGAGRGGHSQFARNENPGFMGPGAAAGGSGGHLMAPAPAPGMGYNQGASPALNPVLGQALTALLASQSGAGLGLTNLLGSLGTPNQAVPPMHGGYGNQAGGQGMMGGGYGNQGGYQNPQMGQGSGGRGQQGGHLGGGVNPYLGH